MKLVLSPQYKKSSLRQGGCGMNRWIKFIDIVKRDLNYFNYLVTININYIVGLKSAEEEDDYHEGYQLVAFLINSDEWKVIAHNVKTLEECNRLQSAVTDLLASNEPLIDLNKLFIEMKIEFNELPVLSKTCPKCGNQIDIDLSSECPHCKEERMERFRTYEYYKQRVNCSGIKLSSKERKEYNELKKQFSITEY